MPKKGRMKPIQGLLIGGNLKLLDCLAHIARLRSPQNLGMEHGNILLNGCLCTCTEEGRRKAMVICRTDNQVKNRWHSALEKVVKNGKSGHGFTDTEFEAEALRRIESERRLLVTPLGEELVGS